MKRFLWLGFVLFIYVICTGCGETYRPVIIPNPPTFPNPAAAHTVVSINDNGTIVPGSAMTIDVSGDTDVSVANVGLAPVHAMLQTAGQMLVVNQSLPGAGSDSLTKLNFGNAVISFTSTITLPPNSQPNFVATTESSQAYVSMPNYVNPITNIAAPSVGVVNTTNNNLVTTIPVGNGPIAIAETPDTQKLYVANQVDSTVSGFNSLDQSPRVGSPASTALPPIWLVARSDSQQVYVLEANSAGSSAFAWLDTTSTAGPDTLTPTAISVPGAARMVYDGNLNRIYIPGGGQVAIVDVSQLAPAQIASIPITAITPATRGAQDPCSSTSPTTLNTVDVAALPNGTRAYAGTFYEAAVGGANYICPQVTVINVTTNSALTPAIAIPGFPAYDAFCSPTLSSRAPRFRIMMAPGGDSSRVYLSSCDGGMVNIIDTSTDSYISNLAAPVGTRAPIPPSALNPPQNPVFLIAGP